MFLDATYGISSMGCQDVNTVLSRKRGRSKQNGHGSFIEP
jgi:hypothetical protein